MTLATAVAPRDVLRRRFGFAAFRPGQEAIVEDVLAGRDVLAVLPTGAGKSLCYQLPALMLDGLTVVASPLVALMKDQVDGMRARGLEALCLHAGMPSAEVECALEQAVERDVRIVLLTPERLASSEVTSLLRAAPVALFVVDEAHCVSEWGHDFRPAYRGLGAAARAMDARSVLALTATATDAVREDIAQSLGLRAPRRHVASFFRPNLRIAIRTVAEAAVVDRCDLLAEILAATPGAAIVYAATRRATEDVAAGLRACGMAAGAYHAGLDGRVRTRVQDAFLADRVRVVVATNAFGLGIDKPDVRSVLHAQIPGSLEAYYQEIGRGGRDGGPCACVTLFAERDLEVRRRLIEAGHPHPDVAADLLRRARAGRLRAGAADVPAPARARAAAALSGLERLGALWVAEFGAIQVREDRVPDFEALRRQGLHQQQMLRRLERFVRMRSGCRHAALLRYFGERATARCEACDRCRGW